MTIFKRFPSYDLLIRNAGESLARFPLALASAVFGTIMAVALIQQESQVGHHTLEKLIMVGALGISFFFALGVFAERRNWSRSGRILFQALGLIPIGLYLISLPENPFALQSTWARFMILIIASHLLVAFLPYLGKGQAGGFWQFNKTLFLRVLFSALYSAVMFIGLAIALLAARELFNLDIPDKRFFQLWVIIVGVFNTWVFLAGVPRDLAELNDVTSYPIGLKIFTQYILLPLVGLYLIILYAYELKIIINWNWPKGWVSQLVLWYSVVGILSLLLLWPLRELTENRWIRNFTKWFFRALIPLVVMLFLAILERVGVYGLTVNRYLVLAMAVGLAILVLYFVFSRKKDIRIIPIIVCVIALLSAYGPWSASAVSRRSQQARLDRLFAQNGILVDGAIKPATTELSFDARENLTSVISYLVGWHGLETMSRWLPESTMTALDTISNERYGLPDTIALTLGFAPAHTYGSPGGKAGESFSYNFPDSVGMNIAGFDHMFYFNNGDLKGDDSSGVYYVGPDTLTVGFQRHPPVLKISLNHDSVKAGSVFEYPLIEPIDEAMKTIRHGQIAGDGFALDTTLEGYDSKIAINHLWGTYLPDSTNVRSISAFILLRKRQ